jgi:beta-glucosidase
MAQSKKLAEETFVLLKNDNQLLPLKSDIGKVALIGPLADKPYDQLGSWASADAKTSITPLAALREKLGESHVLYAPGINWAYDPKKPWEENTTSFLTSKDESGFADAIKAAQQADVVVLVLGELANDSGEASSRSSIDLPGAQNELVAAIAKLGKPVIGVIMAGRPLTIHDQASQMSAVLYTWHGGPMAGPAIVETLFGDSVPSGKLPVTFPRAVGQIPIYYDHLNTGRPASADDHYTSKYLDIPVTPEYPFGYGLSYTTFTYSPTRVSANGDGLTVSAEVTNTGSRDADEVVQFYTHQKAASVARPVRELKGFRRIHLKAGEIATVTFTLSKEDLAFWNQQMKYVTEPGEFEARIAPDSVSGAPIGFSLGEGRLKL